MDYIKNLKKYFPKVKADITPEIIKLWFLILNQENKNKLPEILNFLEPTEYGWVKDKYIFYNNCISNGLLCKTPNRIQDTETLNECYRAIAEIFFHKEYGGIILYIFTYCLISLSSSRIENPLAPFYLQIACEKNTTIYKIIQEFIEICDVNMGISEKCKNRNRRWCCDYQPKIIYPKQEIEKTLNILRSLKDIPVIIDGYKNIRNYNAILREFANKPNRISLNKKFNNLYPIFICPNIKFSFNNVFNMDLTNIIVDDDYLFLIKKNKDILSSFVFTLVKDFIACLFPEDGTEEDRDNKYINGIYPFYEKIENYIININRVKNVPLKIAKNVSVLSFFFTGFIRSLDISIIEKKLSNDNLMETVVKYLTQLNEKAIESLIKIHSLYTPVPFDSIDIKIEENDNKNIKQIEKKAKKYVSSIIECYQNYKTAISITKITVKGTRYIFNVDLLEGTKLYKIFSESENVKTSLKLEYFKVERINSQIIIVVSEKPLNENSLLRIIDDSKFINSKMQIPYAIGYDIIGEMVIEDLSKWRHVLIGGSTGSGKSSALHSMLLSIVCKQSIDAVNLLIFDFGITYLTRFRNVPHLSHPIISEMSVGYKVIMELKKEMERRLEIYNKNPDDRSEFNRLPQIFCIIDEYPAFINHGTKETKDELQNAIRDLLSRSRGLKIHMILAAQDPTEKNMKCSVTNLGTCLAFKCARGHNSLVMIGETKAKDLAGNGEMYLKLENNVNSKRVQGSYVYEKEIVEILEKRLCTSGEGKYKFIIEESKTTEKTTNQIYKIQDDIIIEDVKLPEIIIWSLSQKQIANSRIQSDFHVDNNRVKKILSRMEELLIIEKLQGNLGWKVIPNSIDEISKEVINILTKNGYSVDEISYAFNQ